MDQQVVAGVLVFLSSTTTTLFGFNSFNIAININIRVYYWCVVDVKRKNKIIFIAFVIPEIGYLLASLDKKSCINYNLLLISFLFLNIQLNVIVYNNI